LVILILGGVTGCGFHLRTQNDLSLPRELDVIKLRFSFVSKHTAILRNHFNNEWQHAGGTVSDSDTVPELVIEKETILRHVLSVSPADAKVNEYSLKYILSFRLANPISRKNLLIQKIHLERQYTVDVLNVLAKEHEQEWLENSLREQAIAQIVRIIAHLDTATLSALKPGNGNHNVKQ